jgi:hypothetical protein
VKRAFEVSIFWELPLAALSFAFFKVVRLVVALIFRIHQLASKRRLEWRYASADLFKKPLVLPLIMTTGPRWNTHAIVGTVGPVVIRKSIQVNVAAAERSARQWTIAICAFPGYEPVSTIGSKDRPFGSAIVDMPMEAGKYLIAVRYYHCSASVEFPSLTADGGDTVRAATVPSTLNDVYYSLCKRPSLFYLFLHYYVFVLLRHRRYFPLALVTREFLPSGNPETHFYFGALRKTERLTMMVQRDLLNSYDVYLTMYNRASFPLSWWQVTDTDFASPASTVDMTYLVRVHPSGPARGEFPSDGIQISVQSA